MMSDPLSTTSGIITILQLTGTVVRYLHEVESASKDRRKLLEELKNTVTILHTLKDTAERAERNVPHSTVFSVLSSSNETLKQFKASLEELARRLAPAQDLSRLKRVVFWPFSKAEIREILSKIESQKLSLVLVLESHNIELTQSVENGVSDVHVDVRALRSNIETILQADRDNENRKILDWLSPINVWTKHNDVSQNRQPGTGGWILETPEFRKWLGGNTKTLWCSGAPGVGKTVLASYVIDYIRQTSASDDVGFAYLYCSYQDSNQTALNLMTSILQQLASKQPAIPQRVQDMYKRHWNQKTRPHPREVLECLEPLVQAYTRVFLVVDALDECSESTGARYGLLEALKALPRKLYLLATSRPVSTIGSDLEPCDRLDIIASNDDIQVYVEGQLQLQRKLRTHVLADPTIKEAIITSVIETAQGMFLLARLQLALLARKATRKDVRATLHVLPQGLTEMYEETYKRILDQGAEDSFLADRIILWILRALEPLSVRELQHALAVTPGETTFDESGIVDEDLLLSVCAGLVTIEKGSKIVRLVHWTAIDYFESDHSKRFPDAHGQMAMGCLTYLLFDDFLDDSAEIANSSKTETDIWPFLPYAANCWGHHFLESHNDEVKHLAKEFLQHNGKTANACRYMYSQQTNCCFDDGNGLYVAALFGSTELAEMALRAPAVDINLQSEVGETPLSIACREGSLSLVRMLLTMKEVDVNAGRGSVVGTALHSAAALGDTALVQEILASGVDINAKTDKRHTALHVAAEAGHLHAVDLLIKAGMEMKATTDTGTTALYRAVRGGNIDVLKTILQHDQNVNVTTWDGWTPLHEAVQCNEAGMALHLLEHGGDTSIRTADGETVLGMAQALGRTEIENIIHIEQRWQGSQETPDTVVRSYSVSASSVPAVGGHQDEQPQYSYGLVLASLSDFPEYPSIQYSSELPLRAGAPGMPGELRAPRLVLPTKTALYNAEIDDFPSVEVLPADFESPLKNTLKRKLHTATCEPLTDERHYVCPENGCSSRMSMQNEFDRHMRLQHAPRESFSCCRDGCSFRTIRKDLLARHLKTHFPPPPSGDVVDCPSKNCLRVGVHGFRRKDHLNEHIANFHNGYVDGNK